MLLNRLQIVKIGQKFLLHTEISVGGTLLKDCAVGAAKSLDTDPVRRMTIGYESYRLFNLIRGRPSSRCQMQCTGESVGFSRHSLWVAV